MAINYMRVSLRNCLFVAKTKIILDGSWLQKDYYISVCSNYLFNLIKVIIHSRISLGCLRIFWFGEVFLVQF